MTKVMHAVSLVGMSDELMLNGDGLMKSVMSLRRHKCEES